MFTKALPPGFILRDYTPTWTADVNPAIGNGTLSGWYWQLGKIVIYTVNITMGSTTTYGTGEWLISLPVTATSKRFCGSWFGLDAGTAYKAGMCHLTSTTVVKALMGGTQGSYVGAANPHTWAANDLFQLTIVYEAA